MVEAILYLPSGMPDDEQVRQHLAQYCEARGYDLHTVHVDGWDALHAYADEHHAVIVVADAADVPADRLPRVEVADLGAARPDLLHIQPEPDRRRRPRPV